MSKKLNINKKDLANAIRILSIDAVEKAKSGHPGMPMGMADIAQCLWGNFLKHNPNNPKWLNRDRFVLSNGHGSMLLYSLLHLTGYDLSIDDIKNFRQLNSKTAGHPEYDLDFGIETTTGPLGQGIANAVGMAIAQNLLAKEFNTNDINLIDHNIYCFLGDGCLMEGVSHEVCSLAGTLGLNKLIVFWDDNGISIDGKVEGWMNENVAKRFQAYQWNVIENIDGHDYQQISQAINRAQESDKPSLICCKTIIGFGSKKFAGSEKSHGAPLGEIEVANVRKELSWNYEKSFFIPDEIYNSWNQKQKGAELEQLWQTKFDLYKKQYPEKYIELNRRINNKLPNDWENNIQNIIKNLNLENSIATRKASKLVLDQFSKILPELVGGSADLTGSNLTKPDNDNFNYIYYGVREFGMSAIMNGIALYGGFIPYGGTFLTFSDYAKNAIRMSALMNQKVVYVYTHDSIGLGEDGPTHQPIEHLASLRLMPNVSLWRPCDITETLVAWQKAIENNTGPSCLALSRQNLNNFTRTEEQINNISNGGYILLPEQDNLDLKVIIIATGSEVEIAVSAANKLNNDYKIGTRVISMPEAEVFCRQDQKYIEKVLPNSRNIQKIAIEAGVKDYWYKFVGLDGKIIGLNQYGESAPIKDLYKKFNITESAIIDSVVNGG